MSNEKQWHVARDGRESGPFTQEQLKQMASNGDLAPTDQVWNEDLTEWIDASNLALPFGQGGGGQPAGFDGAASARAAGRSDIGASGPNMGPNAPAQQGGRPSAQYYGSPQKSQSSNGCLIAAVVVAVVLVCVVGVAIMILLPALGAARRTAQRMQNGTQVRGIQQAMVLWSNSNNSYYPGRNVDGTVLTTVQFQNGEYSGNAPTPVDQSAVYAMLLNGQFFTPEYIISPRDTSAVLLTAPALLSTGGGGPPNYSYAFLEFTGDSRRVLEWQDTNNSQAPIVADPSSQIRSDLTEHTYHSDVSVTSRPTPADYEGNIGWNDNHVTFENSSQFQPGSLKLGSYLNMNIVDIMAGGQGQVKFGFNK